jgi:zinc finger protein
MSTEHKPEALFPDLNADNVDETGLSEIESLCFNCYKQGVTRLLLTKIPFFREVIISSFHCEECGYEDRGIQSGSRIEEKGVRYTLTVKSVKDLNRQIVKSDYATFLLPDLDFEQPPSRRGEVTTIEGLLSAIVSGLQHMQSERQAVDPLNAAKVEEFIVKLNNLKLLKSPFVIIIDDPTGNSFVENPNAPAKDDALTVLHYTRTHQQDVDIGIAADHESEQDSELATATTAADEPVVDTKSTDLKDEVLTFATNCPSCNAPCQTNMKLIDIPFFKQVVIMATVCDVCGKRDNEVKSGTGIEPKGTRITLHLTDPSDLNRDVLKSDTCAVRIPELELELMEGTLGGRFTTVEGLLTQIREQLEEKNPFVTGDSSRDDTRSKMTEFCVRLNEVIKGERLNVHLVLDDPAGNSYMQNVYAPEPDPEMTVEHYERSFEANEILGLNDMKVDNYVTNNTS